MKARWITITIWSREILASILALHHLTIDNRVVAILVLVKEEKAKEWRLYTPEGANFRDLSRVPLGDDRFEVIKANNAEQAKLRAANKLVLRWQDYALAGIRLLSREEGG